jgi:hypothetical protein
MHKVLVPGFLEELKPLGIVFRERIVSSEETE